MICCRCSGPFLAHKVGMLRRTSTSSCWDVIDGKARPYISLREGTGAAAARLRAVRYASYPRKARRMTKFVLFSGTGYVCRLTNLLIGY